MKKWAYYNDNDPFACEWLKELMKDGLIAPGEVDCRSILDVKPIEVRDFVQCHWFSGIGVWSLALRLAGWPDDRPVWTGSEPCQPFSDAGQGKGFADERYLRPYWQHLIRVCRPPTLFGEQVASKDGLAWLDVIQTDMEGEDYAFGAVDTCVAGFGAPHIRQRLSWVAHAQNSDRRSGKCGEEEGTWAPSVGRGRPTGCGSTGGMGIPTGSGRQGFREEPEYRQPMQTDESKLSGLADAAGRGWREELADAGRVNLGNSAQRLSTGLDRGFSNLRPGPTNGFWRNADWLHCRDEKWRAVAPGTFPLVDGGTLRNRVAELRGAGNAVNVAQQAGFIEAFLEAESLGFVEQWDL